MDIENSEFLFNNIMGKPQPNGQQQRRSHSHTHPQHSNPADPSKKEEEEEEEEVPKMRIGIKAVIVGESNVGKTSLVCRFCDPTRAIFTEPTIRADLRTAALEYHDMNIRIDICDVSGSEDVCTNLGNIIEAGSVFCYVYSVTNRHSFEALRTYITDMLSPVRNPKLKEYLRPGLLIIGHCFPEDVSEEDWAVSKKEATEFARWYGAKVVFGNAMKNESIELIMKAIADEAIISKEEYYEIRIQGRGRPADVFAKDCRKGQLLAFASGRHKRTGENSPVSVLDDNAMKMIASYVPTPTRRDIASNFLL